jgi:hypothetical protein
MRGTVVCRIASVHEELCDDAQLEHRLGRVGRQGAQGWRTGKEKWTYDNMILASICPRVRDTPFRMHPPWRLVT